MSVCVTATGKSNWFMQCALNIFQYFILQHQDLGHGVVDRYFNIYLFQSSSPSLCLILGGASRARALGPTFYFVYLVGDLKDEITETRSHWVNFSPHKTLIHCAGRPLLCIITLSTSLASARVLRTPSRCRWSINWVRRVNSLLDIPACPASRRICIARL